MSMLDSLIVSRAANPKGLHKKYDVQVVDGYTDPDAIYFVLRLDNKCRDKEWIKACRAAVRGIACALRLRRHKDKLADDLFDLCDSLETMEMLE